MLKLVVVVALAAVGLGLFFSPGNLKDSQILKTRFIRAGAILVLAIVALASRM